MSLLLHFCDCLKFVFLFALVLSQLFLEFFFFLKRIFLIWMQVQIGMGLPRGPNSSSRGCQQGMHLQYGVAVEPGEFN